MYNPVFVTYDMYFTNLTDLLAHISFSEQTKMSMWHAMIVRTLLCLLTLGFIWNSCSSRLNFNVYFYHPIYAISNHLYPKKAKPQIIRWQTFASNTTDYRWQEFHCRCSTSLELFSYTHKSMCVHHVIEYFHFRYFSKFFKKGNK